MSLASGARIGPYEVLGPLGAGGMGEVYRARDARLSRDVAIKVLPASFVEDPDRLRRFEHEARAAGAMNHPNLVTIFDLGTHDGSPFLVMELLEGASLRALVGGKPLPVRKAVDYAVQAAHGLAAAHEKGIVHRDLKPDNLFVTREGRLKILDFGLAKSRPLTSGAAIDSNSPTASVGTEPGVVLGTVGYMSPEQVAGRAANPHSDIFSFGAVLYEMLTGQRAFKGATAVETMNAILNTDPPELARPDRPVPPTLERIVRRCLEKDASQRFRTAHDLAFALETLSGSGPTSGITKGPAPSSARRRLALTVGLVLAGLALSIGSYVLGKRGTEPAEVAFQRLTFRRGLLQHARFAPDQKTIVYDATWDGAPYEIFTTRPESPESRSLDLHAGLASVSSTGELAIFQGNALAQVSLGGGAPRLLFEDVWDAEWAPDDNRLAVARNGGRLEFPPGKLLHQSKRTITQFRFSPSGERIAFFEANDNWADAAVVIVDLQGRRLVTTQRWRRGWGHLELAQQIEQPATPAP